MSFDAHRLLQLLPAVYGLRDRERALVSPGWLDVPDREALARLQGRIDNGFVLTPAEADDYDRLRERALAGPLASLLAVIAEQVGVIEEDLDQLYDDQFIDTCGEWVVPYIGDLIGYRNLHNVSSTVGRARAEVAHTIGFRRRKGTLAVLEELAHDVTGWPASAAEFFQRLITTQHMNHVRLRIAAAPDLRRWEPLERLDTAFDTTPRTVDVRRIEPRRGRHNIPNIGLFVWRLGAYPLSGSPAARVDRRRHRFHPLGIDQPLFLRPQTEEGPTHLATPMNVPTPLSRRVLDTYWSALYGDAADIRSLRVHLDHDDGAGLQLVTAADVRVCHLGDDGASWAHLPPAGQVAIDPVLGRLALPPDATDAWRVAVDFHYGFPDKLDLGGGEYERADSYATPASAQIVRVPGEQPTIQQGIDFLGGDGVVEITDSGRYEEALIFDVTAGASVELRAATRHRPTIVLTANAELRGGADSVLRLNGLLIAGARLQVSAGGGNALSRLEIAHCTLVPGWTLTPDLTPRSPAEPSLLVELADFTLAMHRCITGALRLPEGATLSVSDSIIDATSDDRLAFAAANESPGAALSLESCTVVGRIRARMVPMISNCILLARAAAANEAPVYATLRQKGCVRFTWLPPSSRTPRRHRCLPEYVASPYDALPRFTSLRYGAPGYAQLAVSAGPRLLTGADDESEPGAYHSLHGAWRETNLRVRLDEYLRVGLQAGIFYEN
jgi:hypothetical protein